MTDVYQYKYSGGDYGDDYDPRAPCTSGSSATPAPSPDVDEPEYGELGCTKDSTTRVRRNDRELGAHDHGAGKSQSQCRNQAAYIRSGGLVVPE